MRVDVARRADVAVSEPLLYLFQCHTVGVQKTCTAVTEIMKTDRTHMILFQKLRKSLCDISGGNELTDVVDINVVKIIGAVTFPTDRPILLLLRFQLLQKC